MKVAVSFSHRYFLPLMKKTERMFGIESARKVKVYFLFVSILWVQNRIIPLLRLMRNE